MNELVNEYFDWMYDLVTSEKRSRRGSYRKLLARLHNLDFTYMIGMDGNRAEDGIELRYRFGAENDIRDPIVAALLDDRPCSVLEMIVALSIRCEEHIMDDPDIGNRTGQWFWGMIDNLGLSGMTDDRFDKAYTDEVIHRFLTRRYERNGEGGLFTVHGKGDLRSVEIWYQAMWYLNDILEEQRRHYA